jgi:Flp pilus assembly protein TadD
VSDRLGRAQSLLSAGRAKEALTEVGAHLREFPDDPWAMLVAADAYRQAGRAHESLAMAESAAARLPDEPDVWRVLAHAQAAVGRHQDALVSAIRCADLAPQEWASHATVAVISAELPSKRDMAIRAGITACSLAPEEPQAHFVLGNAYLEKQNWRAAEHEYRAVLALDPHDEGAQHNLAVVQLQRDPAGAALELSRLSAVDAAGGLARHNLLVALGNLVTQAHAVIFLGLFLAVQVLRFADLPQDAARVLLIVLGVLAVAGTVFLAVRARRRLGSRFRPLAKLVLHADRLLAAWVVLMGGALLALLVSGALPPAAWPWSVGVGGALVLTSVILGVVRRRRQRRRRDALSV